MIEHSLRRPRPRDWPAILEIANRSVAHVPGAGPQHEWLENRRRFAASGGIQRHVVAESRHTGVLLGYGSVEATQDEPHAFRVFIVTAPSDLPTIGTGLFDHALAELRDLRAQRAWFTEYASDYSIIDFAGSRGFAEVRRFPWQGVDLIVLERQLGNAAA